MKLLKFNENFQGKTNPWEELKVILTDEIDVSINYSIGTVYTTQNNNIEISFNDDSTKFNSMVVTISMFKIEEIDLVLSKVKEINSHIDLEEDFEFIGFCYNSFRSSKLKVISIDDLLSTPYKLLSFCIVYKIINKNINSCQNCIFRVLEDVGYSNYTVNDTIQHCLKNQWNDNVVLPVYPDLTKGMDCIHFKKNEDDKVSIHIEVEDYLKDCLWGSMDVDLAKAFQEYTGFDSHNWNN
jgi:hypothetical protein